MPILLGRILPEAMDMRASGESQSGDEFGLSCNILAKIQFERDSWCGVRCVGPGGCGYSSGCCRLF
ncbi:hypothetical protein K503DRAFT_765005 [Rhizopogon vinicolor AM-OR11-026]|uniref:Uncharacterized protein n=1 Tax=Rhizopogon vinicolor AM-OR11-026 TaxID=1314800 RepID=A0A1B7NHK1_9AGAM|nr:hypothetical protein K503DRAFT_765005 [Rhizopogon vinicolor AM-OR11-026]